MTEVVSGVKWWSKVVVGRVEVVFAFGGGGMRGCSVSLDGGFERKVCVVARVCKNKAGGGFCLVSMVGRRRKTVGGNEGYWKIVRVEW